MRLVFCLSKFSERRLKQKKTERRDRSVFQTGLCFRNQDLRFRFVNLEHLLDAQILKVSFNALIEMDSGNSKELVLDWFSDWVSCWIGGWLAGSVSDRLLIILAGNSYSCSFGSIILYRWFWINRLFRFLFEGHFGSGFGQFLWSRIGFRHFVIPGFFLSRSGFFNRSSLCCNWSWNAGF